MDFNFLLIKYNLIYYIMLSSFIASLFYLLYRPILGGFYILVFISFLGGILGGKFLSYPIKVVNNFFAYYNVEFFAVILGSFIFNLVFYYLSKRVINS